MAAMTNVPKGGLLLLGAMVMVVALATLVDLPGEARVKRLVGIDPRGCIVRDRGDGEWRTEVSMPSLRDGPAAAVLDGKVYLAGGIESFSEDYSRARSVDTFEVFDVAARRWETLPPLPARLNHVQLAALDGAIFAFGGHTDSLRDGASVGTSWRFDVQRRRWKPIAEMPTPRGGGAVAVLEGKAYVAGGKRGAAVLDTVESYDPATDRWARRAPLPTRRDHLGMAAYRGDLYAVGGRQEDERSMPVAERYDPAADRWTRLPDMPGIKAGFGLEATGGGLIALGGENLDAWTLYGSTFRYRPERGAWERLEGMPEPRHGFGHAVVGGRLYVFGGSVCSGFSPEQDSYSTPVT